MNGDVLRFLSKKNDVWFPGLTNRPDASAIKCCYAAAGSGTGVEETGLRAPVSRKTSIRNHKGIVVAKKMSRKVSRRVVRPACIAGVRISRPNFRAPCGLVVDHILLLAVDPAS